MKRSDFATEPPTAHLPRTLTERSAELVRNWRECSEPQRRVIENVARKLAGLPKAKT